MATANVLHTIPPALQDRMEILRLQGYTENEKLEIARQYLVKKQRTQTGLSEKNIAFKDLGLLIVDEEQHFGVAHKERLKALRADVHVLTLTATPIPRTLQMALSGVREMSVIATPPVDRLAVRTFVLPFDGVVVREAILREKSCRRCASPSPMARSRRLSSRNR